MTFLIDLASFSGAPELLDVCIKTMSGRNITPRFLWRIPVDQAPLPQQLASSVQVTTQPIYRIDLNQMPTSLAAQVLENFLLDRGIKKLVVGHDTNSLGALYAEASQHSYKLCDYRALPDDLNEPPEVSVSETLFETVGSPLPILAIVSPYPPQKSGVADYVAQLLPALSRYYQCVLIIDDNLAEADQINFPGPVITARTFLERPDLHQRVLYQMGNSPGHLYALPLLEAVSGVVTLHDFYMGDALLYEELVLRQENAFLQRLLESHGLNVLPVLHAEGLPGCAARYPSNLAVLRSASLLAIHADYVRRLALETYGRVPVKAFARIPFPKQVRPRPAASQRQALRERYGIGVDDFVVSTFGFGVPTKRHDILIQAWMESRFARDPHAHLLIVGEYPNAQYLGMMQHLCAGSADNIRFVGFVDETTYQAYLDITDLAVQLRIQSRGETSAAIMDCLASGVPVIANDHGTVTELPDHLLWKIPDPPMVAQLLTALEYLQANPVRLADMAAAAIAYLEQGHTLEAAALAYHQAIEHAVDAVPRAREALLIGTAQQYALNPAQSMSFAKAMVYNRPTIGKRQLLIDISEVATHDLRTGIQRVVRSILAELLQVPPEGFEICPIYLDSQQVYRHARQFMLKQYDRVCPGYADTAVTVHAGDVYLGIDLHPTATADAAHIYKTWRAHGVRTVFVLYDLLPVQHPEWFPPIVLPEFTRWLKTISAHADQIVAISQTVAGEMQSWLKQQAIPAEQQPAVGWFHLGADIRASLPTGGLPDDAAAVLDAIGARPAFLMVATVEPRKGHLQALAAMNVLWSRGVDVSLVIVGKKGWMVEDLANQILGHSELGQRLFWLQGISDEYLEAVYPRCAALLAASEGEGFGLPIIEAAQHHIPVIARDIPVFREVGGEGASYFIAEQPEALADHLAAWLAKPEAERPSVERVSIQTWRDSARQIGRHIF